MEDEKIKCGKCDQEHSKICVKTPVGVCGCYEVKAEGE